MSILIKLRSINRDTEEVELETVVNHNNKNHRVWMGRHCFWAFRNNRRIETEAVTEEQAKAYPRFNSEEESEPFVVYAALHSDCVEESAHRPVSLHWSEQKAHDAVQTHKKETIQFIEALYRKGEEGRRDNVEKAYSLHGWLVTPLEIKD